MSGQVLPSFREEEKLWREGYHLVGGVDEVGRGAWAGPFVAAAVIFPPHVFLPQGIKDSKLLSPHRREILAEEIKKRVISFAYWSVDVPHINRYGISWTTQTALTQALLLLKPKVEFALVDYFFLKKFPKKRQKGITKGDQQVISIAAASILAKVYRDQIMRDYGKVYKEYSFENNKGYGTKEHRDAISRLGITPIHRVKFIPDGVAPSVS